MKGSSCVPVILLFFIIFGSGCIGMEMSGFGWIFDDAREPAGSACTSPAVRVANAVMKSESGDGGGGIDPDHCYQAVAVNARDPGLCEKIERAAPRSKCYLLMADKYKDPGICSMMPESLESMDSYSQMECIQTVAIGMGDSGICDQIGERKISRMFSGEVSREACYRYVAAGGPAGRSI